MQRNGVINKLFKQGILNRFMEIIFEIVDKTKRKIKLTRKQYSHICEKHPAVADYFEEIKESLQKPDTIINSYFDNDVYFYYKYYKNLKSPNKFILVIVKYLNGAGFVISAYFEKNIRR